MQKKLLFGFWEFWLLMLQLKQTTTTLSHCILHLVMCVFNVVSQRNISFAPAGSQFAVSNAAFNLLSMLWLCTLIHEYEFSVLWVLLLEKFNESTFMTLQCWAVMY
jgi:hypothetical protein